MDIDRAIFYSNKLKNDDETIYVLLYIAPKKKKLQIQWKPLNVTTVNVISLLLWSGLT